jgi:hypothetical protein
VKEPIFAQGDKADALFCIQNGSDGLVQDRPEKSLTAIETSTISRVNRTKGVAKADFVRDAIDRYPDAELSIPLLAINESLNTSDLPVCRHYSRLNSAITAALKSAELAAVRT